ncbi:hypothetical protein BG006_000318 [Podila minutissima]|uniref:Uncharacterized protein n=1 Tax=Podila minutissima TaxID=64525 RepID=A0A9P5VHQ0_9FUNG|nr:hypothetical protein BG006_000318 [Podila minutissima]
MAVNETVNVGSTSSPPSCPSSERSSRTDSAPDDGVICSGESSTTHESSSPAALTSPPSPSLQSNKTDAKEGRVRTDSGCESVSASPESTDGFDKDGLIHEIPPEGITKDLISKGLAPDPQNGASKSITKPIARATPDSSPKEDKVDLPIRVVLVKACQKLPEIDRGEGCFGTNGQKSDGNVADKKKDEAPTSENEPPPSKSKGRSDDNSNNQEPNEGGSDKRDLLEHLASDGSSSRLSATDKLAESDLEQSACQKNGDADKDQIVDVPSTVSAASTTSGSEASSTNALVLSGASHVIDLPRDVPSTPPEGNTPVSPAVTPSISAVANNDDQSSSTVLDDATQEDGPPSVVHTAVTNSVTLSVTAAAATLAPIPATPLDNLDNFRQRFHIQNRASFYARYMSTTVPVDPAALMGAQAATGLEARFQDVRHRTDEFESLPNHLPTPTYCQMYKSSDNLPCKSGARFHQELGIRCCGTHRKELQGHGGLNGVQITKCGTKVKVYLTPDIFYPPVLDDNFKPSKPLRHAIRYDYKRKDGVLYAQEGDFTDQPRGHRWTNIGQTNSLKDRSSDKKKEVGVSLHMADYYSWTADVVRLEKMVHGLIKAQGSWIDPKAPGSTTTHLEFFNIGKEDVRGFVIKAVSFMKVYFPSSVHEFVGDKQIFVQYANN